MITRAFVVLLIFDHSSQDPKILSVVAYERLGGRQ
jgi:hypothetical protein